MANRPWNFRNFDKKTNSDLNSDKFFSSLDWLKARENNRAAESTKETFPTNFEADRARKAIWSQPVFIEAIAKNHFQFLYKNGIFSVCAPQLSG